MNELYHYGVKGMKWGVRRYQNKDGSLTAAGKEHYMYANRTRNAAKTKYDMDRLYNTLSDEDKKLLGDDPSEKEYLKFEQGEYVVKRFLKKNGDKPIAALDILTTTQKGKVTIAAMTDPNYRGQGLSAELLKDAMKWYDTYGKRYDIDELLWDVRTENVSSRRVAEKSGFEYDPKSSNDEWTMYMYKGKRRKK